MNYQKVIDVIKNPNLGHYYIDDCISNYDIGYRGGPVYQYCHSLDECYRLLNQKIPDCHWQLQFDGERHIFTMSTIVDFQLILRICSHKSPQKAILLGIFNNLKEEKHGHGHG